MFDKFETSVYSTSYQVVSRDQYKFTVHVLQYSTTIVRGTRSGRKLPGTIGRRYKYPYAKIVLVLYTHYYRYRTTEYWRSLRWRSLCWRSRQVYAQLLVVKNWRYLSVMYARGGDRCQQHNVIKSTLNVWSIQREPPSM